MGIGINLFVVNGKLDERERQDRLAGGWPSVFVGRDPGGAARLLDRSQPSMRSATTICVVAAILLAALGPEPVAAVKTVTLPSQVAGEPSATQAFMAGLGVWAYVLAPLLMVVVAVLPIPAEFPAMLNGALFGPLVGTLITWLGAVVGAQVSFEIARRVGRPSSARFVKPHVMDRADRIATSAGWPGLLILRLIPAVAFTAMNWAVGFTAVRRWTFVWTTALGILPGAILFTSSGTGLAALYRANPWAAVGLGIVVALAAWLTISRYRNRRLRLWTGEFRGVVERSP